MDKGKRQRDEGNGRKRKRRDLKERAGGLARETEGDKWDSERDGTEKKERGKECMILEIRLNAEEK